MTYVWGSRLIDTTTTSLLIFAGALILVKVLLTLKKRLPPGPSGLPFFGYLPFIKTDPHLLFTSLASKYGPIFSLKLGSQSIVVLSDYKLIREAFRREDFSGRPMTELHNLLGGYGIINSSGKLWKDQRKFLHDKLRKFGMTYAGPGKVQMEARIMKEVEVFLHTLVQQKNSPVNLDPILSTSISNVICSLVMGVRFQQQDPQFRHFMDLIDEGFKLFGSLSYANFIPIMKYLPKSQDILKKIAQNREEMANFFQEAVDKHRESFDSSNIRDLVDNYLQEIEQAEIGGYSEELFEGKDHDRQIHQVIGDLFSAGMETIKTSILWAVIYMLHKPDVMALVQEELDTVVGRKRLPCLEDRPYLPYTEATILEVLRISSIVPLGTTHTVTRDVEFCGFEIPANTQIVPLLHAVHQDPKLWSKPEEFRPQRFLSPEGKVCKPEFFLPFGTGRRMCLGDVLARMELFEFFSCLLHTFHLEIPPGSTLPSFQATSGVTLMPQKYSLKLTPRPLHDSPHSFLNSNPTSTLRNFGAH